ncbi:MAG: PHP domain-containing protein [Clostridia bacterium]|nr:PHP domain-containing protein [Clostridia bacterium]
MTDYIRNIHSELCAAFPHKVELHAHTNPVSSCSEIAPARLVQMYAELGYSAVCITNHLARGRSDNAEYYLADYYAAKEEGEKLGLNVILGAELRFVPSSNDYLAFGFSPEDVPEIISMLDMNIEEFSRAWRREDRFLCQAHPYREGMEQIDRKLVDGIEAFNAHPHHNSRVSVASRTAHAENLRFVAGTDFHHPGHQGLSATRTRFAPKTAADVVSILRSGDYLSEIGGSIIIP